MAGLIFFILIIIPFIIYAKYSKQKRKRDSGIIFIIFGVLITVIMYLFAFHGGRKPFLDRGIVLFNNVYMYWKVEYGFPFGVGIVLIAIGVLILLLAKNKTSHE